MDCPDCGARAVVFDVPERHRDHAPEGAERAALCPECLTLTATDAPVDARFDRISSAFPDDPAAAVPLAVALGLLDSLALHRRDIEALIEAAEAAGADPLLLLDRLHVQGGVSPEFDIDRRRHQLKQFLD